MIKDTSPYLREENLRISFDVRARLTDEPC